MIHAKPKVLISKCLEFDACRYDGQLITNKYIRDLKEYINFITICPEVEIGLGVPRDPIHLINNKNKLSIYQTSTDRDLGKVMIDFSENYMNSINYIDGVILKSKSPSCAIKTAKHYPANNAKQLMGHGPGLFANQVIKKFPLIPKEEETRLNDVYLREHFYTSIFTIAGYKNIKTFKDLYSFHTKHKLLFMTYNQLILKKMGRIAANHNENNFDDIKKRYFEVLLNLFSRRPKSTSHINTQMHALGFYKNKLSKNEKSYFLNLLENYRNKKISLSAINSVLFSWNMRFENEYLLNQSYFLPFPEDLIEVKRSRMNK